MGGRRSSEARPRGGRGPHWSLAAAVTGVLGARGTAQAQYLAVFVDGRLLKVTGGEARRRGAASAWSCRAAASLEVPLARLDRVIEDEVEAKPEPIPEPSCRFDYAGQALPPDTPFAAEIQRASRERRPLTPGSSPPWSRRSRRSNRWAVSRVGAGGLMQLMPSVWLEQGLANPYDAGRQPAGRVPPPQGAARPLRRPDAGAGGVQRRHRHGGQERRRAAVPRDARVRAPGATRGSVRTRPGGCRLIVNARIMRVLSSGAGTAGPGQAVVAESVGEGCNARA